MHCWALPSGALASDAGNDAEQDKVLLHRAAGRVTDHMAGHVTGAHVTGAHVTGGHVTGIRQMDQCILALCDNTKQASESCML